MISPMSFNEGISNNNCWSALLESISGKSKNQRMANVIKDINKEKAVRHATHNDVNTEFYLSVMNKQKTNKKMEENLYSRYLEESKKNIERIHSFDDNPHSSPS